VGALLPTVNPRAYRLWFAQAERHYGIAYVAEAVGPDGSRRWLATLITGAEGWKNYRVEAVFKTEDDQGWVFGNLNGNGTHAYVLEVYGQTARAKRQIHRDPTVVARRESSGPKHDGGWHRLVAECREDGFRVAVDGGVFADGRDADPAFSRGGFGLQASRFGRRFWISAWNFVPLDASAR